MRQGMNTNNAKPYRTSIICILPPFTSWLGSIFMQPKCVDSWPPLSLPPDWCPWWELHHLCEPWQGPVGPQTLPLPWSPWEAYPVGHTARRDDGTMGAQMGTPSTQYVLHIIHILWLEWYCMISSSNVTSSRISHWFPSSSQLICGSSISWPAMFNALSAL